MGASCCSNSNISPDNDHVQQIEMIETRTERLRQFQQKNCSQDLTQNFTVYKDANTECKESPDNIPITARCSHIMRLCTALHYFEALKASSKIKGDAKRALFVEFNEEIYNFLMDDIAHFIKKHDRDIGRVHSEWTNVYGFPQCSVSECVQTERHYTRRRRGRDNKKKKRKREDEEEEVEDPLYSFYESLYDQMHFHIFHLFDVGMRVNVDELDLSVDEDDKKQKESEGAFVGKAFAAQRDWIISRKRECDIDMSRFQDEHSKYTIQVDDEQHGVTMRDALCDDIARNATFQQQTLQRMRLFLELNAFDSDAVEMDLEDMEDSNLYALIQSEPALESMKKFIRSINLRRAAFSTGLEFKYNKEWDGGLSKNVKPPMYVESKYKNLKEEVLESGYLSLWQWMEFVDLKARRYWKTSDIVKQMKKTMEHYWNESGKTSRLYSVDIELSLEHLFVIILYCDFSALSTAFSGTYRRKSVFESVESVISRHSDFAHFGKLLVDLVDKFGITRTDGNGAQDAECGPFFCGMDRVLNIGSFAITLKGPCSTSTVPEVAMHFAKADGMLLKMNNDTRGADEQTFFDCSWISAYFEEQERLWIAGREPLRIVDLVLIRSAKNYWKAMRALYLFDAMISGLSQDGFKRDSDRSDYELISNLINWSLTGDDSATSEIDWFLKNEWNLFIRNKREIELNLGDVYAQYPSLSELMIFNLREGINGVEGEDNVLLLEWISIFPSLNTIRIKAVDTDKGGYRSYKFRLDSLVKSMQFIPSSITMIIRGGGWMSHALTGEIVSMFDAAGWNIEYVHDWYSLLIKSKEFGNLTDNFLD